MALVLTAMFGVPRAASAVEQVTPDPRIAAVMAEVPGGVLLDAHHAVWPELDMVMETPDAVSAFAVGGCATGYVCVFDAANASGAKISWSSCGNPTVSSFTVRSIANARSAGYAQARYGTTVRATANAGSYANVFSSVNNVRCVA
ncbi:MAG TPA: hypothetical protein VJU58_10940 [Microbacterium sp.]|nr:hypothetical protein [Microbacterium sp.]